MSVSFCLPHPVAVSAFMLCRGLCACTEMLWMCVLCVSFGSKVRPRTFGCEVELSQWSGKPCGNCVDPSRFWGKPVMRTRWMAGTAPHIVLLPYLIAPKALYH